MKKQKKTESEFSRLPARAAEFIQLVIKKMRYRKKVRADVMAELAAHFEDELKDCKSDEEKEQKAQKLIEDFGDAKLLAVLLRRAKKRCRPLWRKALIRSFQALGIIVLYILICFGRLGIGTPTISVNYIDWLNELVRSDRDETKNAKPYYENAAKVCVKIPKEMYEIERAWPADLNDVEIQVFLQWINDNKQAFELVRKGTEKPYCWPIYRSDEMELMKGELMQNVMKPLSDYRNIARALDCQIRYKVYTGDMESALSDCVVMQRFSSHLLQGKGLLVEHLVGIAIESLANKTVFMVLEKTDVPVNVLKKLQEELEKVYGGQEAVINLEAEKAFYYDFIQRCFTDDSKGGGRALSNGLVFAGDNWKSILFAFITMSLPDRREVIDRIDRFYEQANKEVSKTPLELRKENSEPRQMSNNPFSGILTPAFNRVTELSWRSRTSRHALITTVAILRYNKDKWQYPESLNELITGDYLKELPMDPYSDKPLVYKKTDDGFTLYSVGPNFIDDGGEVYRDNKGRVRPWADEGDAVFWPVRK